jgi:hypothetical protein
MQGRRWSERHQSQLEPLMGKWSLGLLRIYTSLVVMIEFDHHPGILLTNKEPSRAYVHSLVRTPNGNDYGLDLLRLHYQHSHKGHRPGE